LSADQTLDQRNADFWNELCGDSLARSIGATGRTRDDLARFDAAYLDLYPYLSRYIPAEGLHGQRVLEIGLGYGTLGQLLHARGADYVGVDLSPGPAEMMRYRGAVALRGSALHLPFASGEFDYVYSIGCLHHTGDLARAVAEVRRVLRNGGHAVVMLYNARSARQAYLKAKELARGLRERRSADGSEEARAAYDSDSQGRAAPHTDFVSAGEARKLFSDFRSITIDRRNLTAGRLPEPRAWLLASRLDRIVGLDLYVRARA
jgi:SAM-dependent methyltransferase